MRVVDANKLRERFRELYVEETEWENKKIVGKILDIINESILTDASYSADHSECYGDNFNRLIENLYTFYECTHSGFNYRTFEEETECFDYGALHIAELMYRVFDTDAVAIANYICLIHNKGMLSHGINDVNSDAEYERGFAEGIYFVLDLISGFECTPSDYKTWGFDKVNNIIGAKDMSPYQYAYYILQSYTPSEIKQILKKNVEDWEKTLTETKNE